MKREDWLWLLLKAAGVWLIVAAFEVMAVPGWSWYDYGESDTAGREQLLRVLVPLVAGLCLLLVDFARWLPTAPPEPASLAEPDAQPDRVVTMSRSDWLWLGLKLIGAWYAIMMVVLLGQYGLMTSGEVSEWVLAVIGPMVTLALSLWLLFGDRIWHVATRNDTSEPVTRGPARKYRHVRDVVFVVMVFAIMAAIPIVVLWWFAGRD